MAKLWIFGFFLLVFVVAVGPSALVTAKFEERSSLEAPDASAPVDVSLNTGGKRMDLTELTGPVEGKLEEYLLAKDPGPLSLTNFLQHGLRRAVAVGVPATTLVLLLLFPLVGAIIAAARHLVGLRGFGLFTTAALSIAFLTTGIGVGMVLFVVILAAATGSRWLFRALRLQYLPRIALFLWFVSIVLFAVLSLSSFVGISLAALSIFPILLLVLLSESFINSQMGLGMRRAIELAGETVILAVVCSLVLSLDFLQRFAILNPEVTVLLVAVFDVFLGKYVGLRLMEYWRFRELLG